ncbi:Hypothetical predicted protein [Lecanosticta acicola]|uniref:Uncharacterized protein n=1 Tax=Lecanosticta acicola TaxID=111012 RepID=A0AAI9EFN7_9PEZI|nr:Hypothetical predicted protein [Lecanosticta acicola]
MDKLKNMLHSGGKKHDDASYGDSDARRESASKATHQPAPTLHATEDGRKNDHSILRQVLNPGDDKYDEQRYGATATTQRPDPNHMQTHPEHEKDHTILDQILNPNNEKYDERMFNETGATGGARNGSVTAHPEPQTFPQTAQLETKPGEEKKEHTILRQILNPHGDKYDQQTFGQNAAVEGGSSLAAGPSGGQPHMAAGAVASGLADRPHPLGGQSHLGRDTAIAGGLVGASGAGAYAGAQHNNLHNDPNTKVTARPHPLHGHGTGAHINPVSAPETAGAGSTPQHDSHLGRDAALAGGAGLAGVPLMIQLNQAPADVQNATYTARAFPLGGPHQTDTANVLDPHVPGEYPTETGEDRHAVNEPGLRSGAFGGFTSSAQPPGQYSQHTERDAAIAGGLVGAGAGAGAEGAAAYSMSNRGASGQAPPLASAAATGHPGGQGYPTSAGASAGPVYSMTGQSGSQHNYARDAALAGGTGAAGVGAYELGKNRDDGTSPDTGRLHDRNVAGVDPSMQREAEALKPGNDNQHHYGRDAAVAGGAGAAGVGAYELGKNYDDGTSPDTGRLHDRNVAGVDPSMQREAEALKPGNDNQNYGRDAAVAGGAGAAGVGAYELAKDRNEPSKHTGPHETSVANASDLKSVNKPNEPSIAGQDTQQQHHYGRDAAVAGGAGAAGAGAYEAAKQGPPPSNLAKGGDPTVDASKHPAETWDPKKIVEKHKEIRQEQDDAAQRAAQRTGDKSQASYADKAHDDKHDGKLQKQQRKDDEDDEKEKKPGLISRIMHPGRKDHEAGDERPHESSGSHISGDNRVSEDDKGHHRLHKKSVEQQHGTDGSQQMSGYHPHETGQGSGEQGVAGPDWDAIKKSNTSD